MATLEAFRCVLDDARTPEIIRHHIIDALQYALRNYGQVFTAKEVEWLAAWDDPRIPLAARKELDRREPAAAARKGRARRQKRRRSQSRAAFVAFAPSLAARRGARRHFRPKSTRVVAPLSSMPFASSFGATMNIRLESTLPSRYWRTACARA
ncbi:Uncharacterised protein [Burkholderia pseudomallei]|nr:Uncharacterised protein [Burkholderia pseudomallei]